MTQDILINENTTIVQIFFQDKTTLSAPVDYLQEVITEHFMKLPGVLHANVNNKKEGE